ncbi:hypothetical protein ADK67_14580 [Saccharothrix sp. NRRL B-16348]|uniref:hypothetical protein n=1 Tax=Saccharothrix sp. NRRL B-16348 TaxID=1415542 RepID=UPI0006C23A21|nr:hypothetical protein [Saccharothrix sp. NRRL B-16348]KOX27050.1 hypothetical protein ADK67_14580 [Saccharothrix sp. NRRL B-16348]
MSLVVARLSMIGRFAGATSRPGDGWVGGGGGAAGRDMDMDGERLVLDARGVGGHDHPARQESATAVSSWPGPPYFEWTSL